MKRAFDLVAAVVGLVVLAPVLAVIAVLVRLRLGSPVLFRQERLGRHEQPFAIVKFRTMTNERGADGALLPDADRLAPLGRRLRDLSLDELPELWNVVRGQMSLVGPRPLPVAYRDRYRPHERARHDVRPGITGWAQVAGRNRVRWDERLELDVWYVQHRSFWLDLKILGRTIAAVADRSGIAADGHATMPELRPPTTSEP
jgi:sugar transferase EpsL